LNQHTQAKLPALVNLYAEAMNAMGAGIDLAEINAQLTAYYSK
jgi:hypothetical protein